MVSSRTLSSLAQFLAIQEIGFMLVLCEKHGLELPPGDPALLTTLNRGLISIDKPEKWLSILEEIARTIGDLRSRVTPKYRFDERLEDLKRCLKLDGYLIDHGELLRLDPSIDDLPPLEDDLTKELRISGLLRANEVIGKVTDSAESFRLKVPNYNACLNDIRVSLETLAAAIAKNIRSPSPNTYDPTKWGSVIAHLRAVGFITQEEERGLAGVYGFVSSGSHRPIGMSEEERARLGRNLALSMCWFLIKQFNASR